MTTTPISRSKLSCKNRAKTDVIKESESCSSSVATTPSNKNVQVDCDGDYSPLYFPLTQEEGRDVLWDWNSPQSSQRKRIQQKRLIPIQSPKIPLKRYPSNNHNENFERLRNELKALQEELAMPDDESFLCVSPQQEADFKMGEGNNQEIQSQPHCDEFDDIFNDSMDDQLLLFSQKIESEMMGKQEMVEEKTNFSTTICDKSEIDQLINKYSQTNVTKTNHDHSKTDKASKLTVATPKHSRAFFQRTLSDIPISKTENIIQTVSGRLEFHRTKSFELAGLSGQDTVHRNICEEIERKRLEAKAKLESKKKKDLDVNKCSPEEIEKKRLQALAKLEAKRLQDIVEKKRQEALKKLQANRLKNASEVRSLLTTRL